MTGRPKVDDLRVGDVVRLKKAHPCGGFLWLVNRIGGDIGLRCETCGHYVMIPRFRIERRIREIVRPAGVGEKDPGDRQLEATGEFNAKTQRRKERKQ